MGRKGGEMKRESKDGKVSARTKAFTRAKRDAYGGCRHTSARHRRRIRHAEDCRHDRPHVPQMWDEAERVWVKG